MRDFAIVSIFNVFGFGFASLFLGILSVYLGPGPKSFSRLVEPVLSATLIISDSASRYILLSEPAMMADTWRAVSARDEIERMWNPKQGKLERWARGRERKVALRMQNQEFE